MKILFFKNGPNPASFCLISWMHGCQARGGKMEGADESTGYGGTPSFSEVFTHSDRKNIQIIKE